MARQGSWKPGYAAIAVSIVVPIFTLIVSYRPAVRWIDTWNKAQNTKPVSDSSPNLPVTGVEPAPHSPGFPWWALAILAALLFSTLFLWRAGYKNVLAASSRASANAAERRARSYTFDATIFQFLDEEDDARRLHGIAGRFARAALALKGTSQTLNRIESVGAKLDLPPVETEELSSASADDSEQYQGMPPRLDSITED